MYFFRNESDRKESTVSINSKKYFQIQYFLPRRATPRHDLNEMKVFLIFVNLI